jgi:hypothetical protein
MTALRASMAWRLLPLGLAAELFAIFSRGTPWLGEWNWTTDWVNGATVITMPLVAACAAYDASASLARESRPLLVSTSRGVLGFTWPVWASFAVFAPVHLIGLLIGFGLNAGAGAGGAPSLVSVPLAFTVLAAAAAIGQGIGVILPNLVAAPLAGAVLLGMNMVGAGNLVPQFMRVGGATGTLVGQSWGNRVLLLDLLIHLGLVAALTWGLARITWPRLGKMPRQMILVAGAVTVIGAVLTLQWNTWTRLQPSTGSVDLACRQGTTEVCLAEATSRKLPSLSRALDGPLAVLEAASVAVPARFQQVVPGQPALPTGTAPLFIESTEINATSTSFDEAATHATQPAACPQLTADKPPPQAYFAARQLLFWWLLTSDGDLDPRSVADATARQWLLLPPSAQVGWVRTTYGQLTACALDEVRLPVES